MRKTSVSYFLFFIFFLGLIGLSSAFGSPNKPPKARAEFSPKSGDAPLTVFFDASTSYDLDGTIVKTEWDFNDGSFGNGTIVQHKYLSEGHFKAVVTVTDNEGATDSKILSIQVRPGYSSPIAQFTYSPQPVFALDEIAFDARSSYLPAHESETDRGISECSWQFIESSTGDKNTKNESLNCLTFHQFTHAGVYNVKLTVTATNGLISQTEQIVNVLQRPTTPIIDFMLSTEIGYVPFSIVADGYGSYLPGYENAPDRGIVSCTWELVGGSTGDKLKGDCSTSYFITAAGDYSLTLDVVAVNGSTATLTKTFQAFNPGNLPPVANFSLTPESGTVPFPITVDGSSSYLPGHENLPGRGVLGCNWELTNAGNGEKKSGECITSFFITTGGQYTIQLEVIAIDGSKAYQTKTFEAIGGSGNQAPVAAFTLSPDSGTAPLNVHFDASTSYDLDGTIVNYQWVFSDQTSASGIIIDRTFTEPGTYFANLIVTDNSGATNSYSQSITVFGTFEGDGDEVWSDGILALVIDQNDQFHPLVDDLTLNLSGAQFDTNIEKLRITINGIEVDNSIATISNNQIQLDGLQFEDGKNELIITAYDTENLPLQETFILWAGGQVVSINALDENNNPIADFEITIKLLGDQKILKTVSHANSSVSIENLPNEAFVIIAQAGDLLGIKTVTSLSSTESITLLGIKPVSTIDNDDFSLGTDGWDISEASPTIVPHSKKFDIIKNNKPNDQDMRIGLENDTYQKVTRTVVVSGAQTKFYDFSYKFSQGLDDILQIVLRNATTGESSNVISNKDEGPFWKNIRVAAKLGDVIQVEMSLTKSTKNNRKVGVSHLLVNSLLQTSFAIEYVYLLNLNLKQPESIIAGLSVGPRVQFSTQYNCTDIPNKPPCSVPNGTDNYTTLRGSFLLTGEGTVLTGIKIVAQQLDPSNGSIRVAEAPLEASVANLILGQPIPAEGFIVSNLVLFQFKDGNLEQFDRSGRIQLDIVATTAISSLPTQYPGLLVPLVQYNFNNDLSTNRMNKNRDPREGGDDWIRGFVIPYVDSLLSTFATDTKYQLVYNDISKMNGGKPSDHSSHQYGNDVDLRIDGYCTKASDNDFCLFNNTTENAQNMVKFLNKYSYLNRITDRKLFVTFPRNEPFHNYLKFICLSDNRPALDVINKQDNHSDHFHVRFQENSAERTAPEVSFGLPVSELQRAQTINVIGAGAFNGSLKVNWGDGQTSTVTGCTVTHPYASNGPYTIRGMYLKDNACIGLEKLVEIADSVPYVPCITAVPSNFGSVELSSCSTGKIAKYEWTDLPESAGTIPTETKGCGGPPPLSIFGLSNGTHEATLKIWKFDGSVQSTPVSFTTSNGDKKIYFTQKDKITSERLPSSILACGPTISAPVAAITLNNVEGATASFSGASSGEVLSYEWTSTEALLQSQTTCFPNVTFGYPAGGTYQVRLKVTNFDGITSQETAQTFTVPGNGDY